MAQRERRPKYTTADRIARAHSLKDEGLLDDAIAELRKALRASAEKSRIYREMAVLFKSHHRLDEALRAARRAVKADTNDPESRELLISILLEMHRCDEAIEESKDLIALSVNSIAARDALSTAYLQKGMLSKAIRVVNELISLDPSSPENHFRKAILHHQKGDVSSAMQEFCRVLEMAPGGQMEQDAEQAVRALDTYQLRSIITLAVEDYIFRTKLIRDPTAATLERGFYLSYTGMAALSHIRFEDLGDIYPDTGQRHYH
ncbi:MAG: tetratricopeptide repeat protein [Armatimonadota bacterium]|jgi:tetratricopeptide (TPR) repeat protein